MSPQVQSQVFGLSLALVTAVGCLAYERLTKACSYFTVGLLVCLSYTPFFCASLLWNNTVKQDLVALSQHKTAVALFILSGATGPLWYSLTRTQSVMVGSIYEVKYIFMLALFYIFFGSKPMTANMAVGITFALISLYFISKG